MDLSNPRQDSVQTFKTPRDPRNGVRLKRISHDVAVVVQRWSQRTVRIGFHSILALLRDLRMDSSESVYGGTPAAPLDNECFPNPTPRLPGIVEPRCESHWLLR